MEYKPNKIEQKWQKFWEKNQTFQASEKSKKDKFYGLVEFPYPSGDGLHTGHLRSYTALDIVCRQQRMLGKEVLYPMGMDAFGLPTENFAVKHKIAPQQASAKNISNFNRQLKQTGYSFDWSRYVETIDPKYYKWTQWIFIQMFKKGLAYKATETINWCLNCKIGLANEEVVGGVCERCGGEVVKKAKEQWMLKITDYADRLLADLDKVDFLDKIKTQQSNWIGKSQGAEVIFKIKSDKKEEDLKIFTTRPDTLFGATFMVVAPEQEIIQKFKNNISNFKEVAKYIKISQKKSDLERTDLNKNKTGVELKGITAINPVNNKSIPIYVADYVMMNYGTGAIMAVPAHDARDFEFAKKYKLEIIEVVTPVIGQPHKDAKYRQTISAVVQRKSDNKFLFVKWNKFGWVAPSIGGIGKGETPESAAVREVLEETGYKVRSIKKLGSTTEEHFYADNKKIWRHRVDQPILLEIIDESQKPVEISAKEKARHDIIWLDADKALEQITHEYNKFGLLRFLDRYVYSSEGIATNSGEFNGLITEEFKKKIITWLTKNKLGKAAVNYKLRDWIFSRQRYWGEPIPMVHCVKCGWQPVDDKDLPVELPKIKDFIPTDNGESPLAKVDSWVDTKCPKCKGPAKRETDVMPNWAGSNWYFVRYCDPNNDKQLVDPKKASHWLPVDWYNGGMEHTTLHLLYSRFVFKFLYDIGAVPKAIGDEPYKKRTAQGMILGKGGVKMSKSKSNVVNPDIYIDKYGADTTRLYIMFMGPFDQDVAWDDKGVIGLSRFLHKVWNLQTKIDNKFVDKEADKILHQTIKKVEDDIDNMSFNTAIAQMMILVNYLDKQDKVNKKLFSNFILLLSPFAPHITEELWSILGNKTSLATAKWPVADTKLAQEKNITLGIQVNGKVRDEIELALDTMPSKQIEKQVLGLDKIKKAIANKKIKKFIHIKNKIISIVV